MIYLTILGLRILPYKILTYSKTNLFDLRQNNNLYIILIIFSFIFKKEKKADE